MRLNVIVATIEGCSFCDLNDPALLDHALAAAVDAGGFHLLHKHIHRFEPQGLTGAAILSESHIAVHSWPERGVLFVDLATCGGREATEAAFNTILDLFPHAAVRRNDIDHGDTDSRDTQPKRAHATP